MKYPVFQVWTHTLISQSGSGWRQQSTLICSARDQETRLVWGNSLWNISPLAFLPAPIYLCISVLSFFRLIWPEKVNWTNSAPALASLLSQSPSQRGWLTGWLTGWLVSEDVRFTFPLHSWMLLDVNIIAWRPVLLTTGSCALSEQSHSVKKIIREEYYERHYGLQTTEQIFSADQCWPQGKL